MCADMSSRERMLIALNNGRPDRLPCQVHTWTDRYLKNYLGGLDWWQAFEKFGMDFAIYVSPTYRFAEKYLANWDCRRRNLGRDEQGNEQWEETIVTPKGNLHHIGAANDYTSWEIEDLIKGERDIELYREFLPRPISADFTEVQRAMDRIGDRGVIRSHPLGPGQGSPWQNLCILAGTERAIMWAMTEPDLTHHALQILLDNTLQMLELWKGIPSDMVETGGGAGSNTVISPTLFREFCLPYDKTQHAAYHDVGVKVSYHLCGGLMQMLEMVAENGADGLETMTPPSMGGDCDLAEASRRVGDRLFFLGGFDQHAGFERGTRESIRRQVFDLFEGTKDHAGYICCPSDQFFDGDPRNIQFFVDSVRECRY